VPAKTNKEEFMKLLISNEFEKEFDRLLGNYSEVYILTAWATVGFPIYEALVKNANKIKKCVVGLHFYQTHPDFISAFLKNSRVRFIKNPEGVFHPKTYLFKNSEQDWECIIGSANLTRGAFYNNYEIGVLISALDAEVSFVTNLINEMELQWKVASSFSDEELADYRVLWDKFRPKITGLSNKYRRNKKKKLVVDLLSLSWGEYFRKVTKEDKYHSTAGRLLLLSEVNNAFKTYGLFHAMPLDIRTAIAGFKTGPIVEEQPEWTWGWFGSMVGSGNFKHTVKENNKYLSSALEAIPISGIIRKSHFEDFRQQFMKSFGYKNPLGVATRLLCVKRPDYFVGINNANRIALCEALDSKKSLNLAEYWEEIIEPIIASNWWKATIPNNDTEKQVFNARVAFLDAIYYEPI